MKYYVITLVFLLVAPQSGYSDNKSSDGYTLKCNDCLKIVYHPRGDRDRDGIPNAIDRKNNNGPNADRDRDGIPNKNDNYNDNRAYGDRDHDGIANIRDDRDNRLDPPKNR